ncbi:MAG: hypothetical protein LC754_06135 [Acidobacteria bacterium]|nr:hypothetical protein [Acidobacteriota bacterium]
MANGNGQFELTYIANVDMTNHIFKFVKKDTNGRGVVLATDGGPVLGILQNKPALGQAAIVRIEGESPAIVGPGGLNEGDLVASDANGMADTAAAGELAVAVCIQGGNNASGAYATVVMQRNGKQ